VHRLVASWFGTGLILRRLRGSDAGSGTVGALFALPLVWVLGEIGVWAQILGVVVVVAASIVSSSHFVGETDSIKHGDPGWVVVDEAAGVLLATVGLGFPAAAVAWIVFRIADIFKTWFPGVAQAESLGGGLGITADDLVAGFYGLAAGWIFQLLIG
jgi:phosphatidylglycerophosphatase A